MDTYTTQKQNKKHATYNILVNVTRSKPQIIQNVLCDSIDTK